MRIVFGVMGALVLTACASAAVMNTELGETLKNGMKADFTSKGPATVERMLNQDDVQKLCSANPLDIPDEKMDALLESQLKTVKYPADEIFLGDWKEGEKIAQNGRGLQSSDPMNGTNGGNCYACHQLSKQEISFGNIGPSLYKYGARGQSPEIVKYTWAKIYNSQAFTVCSNMPRFGHSGILTEKQIKDVMALLFDKNSPVNE
jgi:sulfur-oxidizing protein SoxX